MIGGEDDTRTLQGRRYTRRESEILQCAAQGMPNKMIAVRLGVSERTIATHLERIFARLGVHTRTEAVLFWMSDMRTEESRDNGSSHHASSD